MTIRVALHHQTVYRYDRRIQLGAQEIRLRPAAHARTPIDAYSLVVKPDAHYLNWQQDPFGNYLARCVFTDKVDSFQVDVDLVATMTVINPFDFFLEPSAEQYPFGYSQATLEDLKPYLRQEASGAQFEHFLSQVDCSPRRTIDFLVDLNRAVHQHVSYTIRMEPGVQLPEETLVLGSGSCRDSAWLLVQLLRRLGFAARFVSGYLIQLKADQATLDGPSGPSEDFTDLHAWAEVYLPGAGWVGLDPTSGLFAGEGHVPLACTPSPISAAPITGSLEECQVEFSHDMSVDRIHEDPRVTLPYSDKDWQRISGLAAEIDGHLLQSDVRLTMGGEPTFVSIDDMEGEEWQTAADGPTKRGLAYQLLLRLKQRFGPAGILHFGQGKWYPGEPLPRWSMALFWRRDGQPIWSDPDLLANIEGNHGHTVDDARRFAVGLAANLKVDPGHAAAAFEDAMYYMWRERRLPANVDVHDSKLELEAERVRIARIFEHGLTNPVGWLLPLRHVWWEDAARWISGEWAVRSEELFLVPGDSAMGYRLPLLSLKHEAESDYADHLYTRDPLENLPDLPNYRAWCLPGQAASWRGEFASGNVAAHRIQRRASLVGVTADNGTAVGNGPDYEGPHNDDGEEPTIEHRADGSTNVLRTALCVEPRDGILHVFLPPLDRIESFLELVAAVETTAGELQLPVVIEGYEPPHDSRIQHLRVTPDPGVIEVNVPPAANWQELAETTYGVYDDARRCRLGTEKFDLDGEHSGTGGGNHVVLGGPTPADSPWLRRPDLLKSFLCYWHNHPALSYLFSGRFIGPTSQAPRVDESRTDAVYELQIACQQIACPPTGTGNPPPPWLVDRVFRHLLVDVTGNTHRAEFCIDKLYSPDQATGRLGLVEFRGFEMPPHARMSLTQQLLLRGLVVRFWEQPYDVEMVDWGHLSARSFHVASLFVGGFSGRYFGPERSWFRFRTGMVCAPSRVSLSEDW